MNDTPHIVVFGAGSIGCFVGGLMQAAGKKVTFIGRQRIIDLLSEHGLNLTGYDGMDLSILPSTLQLSQDASDVAQADIILVCVKSGATSEVAETILNHAKPSAVVASLQNGMRNAETLSGILTKIDVRAGMVPFNVVQMGDGRFHRATSGEIMVQSGSPDLTNILRCPNLMIQTSDDMQAVLSGKLLVNLNNALNALSDLPLVEQLSRREWRVSLAKQMDEALAVFKAEGVTPKPPSPVPAGLIPHILRLPTFLFKRVAKQMLEIDPNARSSMWEDLEHGRKTEIGELQGEIIRRASEHGIDVPENLKIHERIREAETS
ncbi:MAG: 2-dehydropantoate 2-reductase [Pseudomonadota bacterium]